MGKRSVKYLHFLMEAFGAIAKKLRDFFFSYPYNEQGHL